MRFRGRGSRGNRGRTLNSASRGRGSLQLRSLMPWLLLAFLVWLVGYPLLVVAAEAFGIGGLEGDGPTTEAFRSFFSRADEWNAMWRTLWISVLSTLAAAAVGVPLGFLFERNEIPGRRLLGALVALPVALPPLVGVIAFLFLYGESGLAARGLQTLGFDVSWRLTGPAAILLVHSYSMYVYFYLFTRAGLSGQDGAAIEAAQSLGAKRSQILFRVTLPRLRPALAGATLLTFMTSLGSFSAPYIFGGGFRVMTTQIVASKLNGELRMAYVETTMLALMAFGSRNAMAYLVVLLVALTLYLYMAIAYVALATIHFFNYLFMLALSRCREYAADRVGATLTGSPLQLANALHRIDDEMNLFPDDDLRKLQTANAFLIVSAIRNSNFVMNLLATHPSVEKRIAKLREMHRGMESRT